MQNSKTVQVKNMAKEITLILPPAMYQCESSRAIPKIYGKKLQDNSRCVCLAYQ